MTVEMVFPSPLVPSRKCTFVRYCKELQNKAMLVVDVSSDGGDGTFFKCHKMPTGVLIQPLERNSCKVWQKKKRLNNDEFLPCVILVLR
jgi:hypothetical protein